MGGRASDCAGGTCGHCRRRDSSPDVSPVLPCGREVKPPGRTEDTDDVDGSTPEAPGHLAQLLRSWHGDATQLHVEEGAVVRVWTGSQTELGWLYAELLCDSSQAGWLPCLAVADLPSGSRQMRVARSCEATCDVQLAVEAGWSLIVDMDSCTEEGWVYAAAVVKRG